jgi:hypothetical protein
MTETDDLQPISDISYLKTLLDTGFKLVGPRNSPDKDIKAIEQFFKKGHVFFPEGCLVSDGCSLVEPSALTKGLKFAYKCEGEVMFRYHKSKYSLLKDDVTIALYLKSPEH